MNKTYKIIELINQKENLFKRFYVFVFRGGGRREKERESNIDPLPLVGPQLGTWRTTQTHTPRLEIENGNLLVCRTMPNLLGHISQGGGCLLSQSFPTLFGNCCPELL